MVLKPQSTKPEAFVLPPELTGQTDINRLLRELETLDGAMVGQQAGTQPSKITNLLLETANANGYKLADPFHRQHITEQLTKIHDRAPLLHISFAAEPSPKVIQTVLAWLRANIHRYALLQIGLQPAIAAGCVLRTPNKIFDMSLGASLQKQKPFLLQLIQKALNTAESQPTTKAGSK